jgi:hypothetical protein
MNDATFRIPQRVHRAEEAARLDPGSFAKLVPALHRTDVLADAFVRHATTVGVNPALLFEQALRESDKWRLAVPVRDLLDEVRSVPEWVVPRQLRSGGDALRRAGVTGGFVLAFRSLVSGYAAPAGNKPLAFSGRLTQQAARRLDETGRFVRAVSEPGGMLPGGEGWMLAVKVRLMHASVRQLLLRSGRWDEPAWSVPINQHDMLATILLFSSVWLEGCRMLGVHFSAAESEDHMHLWRYVGYVMGVDETLLPLNEAHGAQMQRFIHLTQGVPDEDSRALVGALLTPPADRPAPRNLQEQLLRDAFATVLPAVCRFLIGDELADALHLRRSPADVLVRSFAATRRTGTALPKRLQVVARLEQLWGERYWNWSVGRVPGTLHYGFESPAALAGRPLVAAGA